MLIITRFPSGKSKRARCLLFSHDETNGAKLSSNDDHDRFMPSVGRAPSPRLQRPPKRTSSDIAGVGWVMENMTRNACVSMSIRNALVG